MHNTQGFKRLYIIRDGSEGIKSLTSMIGKTVIKLAWIFSNLDDFFSKLKPISTYLLTGFHTFYKIILSVF